MLCNRNSETNAQSLGLTDSLSKAPQARPPLLQRGFTLDHEALQPQKIVENSGQSHQQSRPKQSRLGPFDKFGSFMRQLSQ